jgi:hypothetical protein
MDSCRVVLKDEPISVKKPGGFVPNGTVFEFCGLVVVSYRWSSATPTIKVVQTNRFISL